MVAHFTSTGIYVTYTMDSEKLRFFVAAFVLSLLRRCTLHTRPLHGLQSASKSSTAIRLYDAASVIGLSVTNFVGLARKLFRNRR